MFEPGSVPPTTTAWIFKVFSRKGRRESSWSGTFSAARRKALVGSSPLLEEVAPLHTSAYKRVK